jgi:hypothetical protein
MQVWLLEKLSRHRLTHICPIGDMSFKPVKGFLNNLSPFLCAEGHLEHLGRSLFLFSFLLRVPVFVSLVITILQLSSKHLLSQGGG